MLNGTIKEVLQLSFNFIEMCCLTLPARCWIEFSTVEKRDTCGYGDGHLAEQTEGHCETDRAHRDTGREDWEIGKRHNIHSYDD